MPATPGARPKSAQEGPSAVIRAAVANKNKPAEAPGPENLDPFAQPESLLFRKSFDTLEKNLEVLPKTTAGISLRNVLKSEGSEAVQTGGFLRKFLDGVIPTLPQAPG